MAAQLGRRARRAADSEAHVAEVRSSVATASRTTGYVAALKLREIATAIEGDAAQSPDLDLVDIRNGMAFVAGLFGLSIDDFGGEDASPEDDEQASGCLTDEEVDRLVASLPAWVGISGVRFIT